MNLLPFYMKKKETYFSFRALDLLSGKTVAIKQIDLKSSKKQDVKDMIVKEEEINTRRFNMFNLFIFL